jgi:hypothetical protein
MQPKGKAPGLSGVTARRPARRYATCAEALQAIHDLETLAEDEVSWLRTQGREAEADRRADAWAREVRRAAGEAAALREALARPQPQPAAIASPPKRRHKPRQPARSSVPVFVGRVIARGFRRSPLATSLALLLAFWLVWTLINALAPLIRLIDLAGWTAVFGLVAIGAGRGWRER